MPPTPKPILLLALILSSVALGAAAAATALGVRDGQWLAVGLGVVACVAAVLGALTGLGRFKDSPPLAMFSVGGTVIVAAALAFMGSGRAPEGSSRPAGFLPALAKDPLSAAMLAAGAGLVFLAGLTLLLRKRSRSVRLLGLAAALGAPVAAAAWAWTATGLREWLGELHVLALSMLAFAAFFVLSGLLSVSLHCAIRAFEIGWAGGDPQEFRARQKSL